MAVRPVFVVSLDNQYCIRENIEFEFFNGFSEKQKRRCINLAVPYFSRTKPILVCTGGTGYERTFCHHPD